MTRQKRTEPYRGSCGFCEKAFESWLKKRFCSDSCRQREWRLSRQKSVDHIDVAALLESGHAKLADDIRYAVTRDGRVYSRSVNGNKDMLAKHWRELVQARTGSRRQYLTVHLGLANRWDVHRLVMHVFVGTCPSGQQVRHLDGNPANNRIENLAYGTATQNMADAVRHGTTCKGRRNAMAILDEENVRVIRRLHEAGAQQIVIASGFGVSLEAVSQIVRRKRWGWLE